MSKRKGHKSEPAAAEKALAEKALELSIAAPQVVAHRVTRMLTAGPMPSAEDREEFMTMGSEKVVAFSEGFAAMCVEAMTVQTQAAQSLLDLPLSHPDDLHKAVDEAVRSHAEGVTKVLDAGLSPVHAKAVSNAKRLARHKKG
ncbi:MAG: hypothetical protein KF778_22225 [Rhodocyclaceae bacterium]|nr:hypothetical protein [Rhodocyclaceae bacterium]MBX3671123.1 hypothetical protein [Rhodocyclaceae bacterium]